MCSCSTIDTRRITIKRDQRHLDMDIVLDTSIYKQIQITLGKHDFLQSKWE
jgi:hypothetical protein